MQAIFKMFISMEHVQWWILGVLLASYLLGTEFMSCTHEMSTYHWEDNTVAILSWKLHALLELVLKDLCIKAKKKDKESTCN